MEPLILVFIFVILPILVCSNIADNKGRNIPIWVLLSLLFSWLAVLIIACLSDKTVDQSVEEKAQLKADLEIKILKAQLKSLENNLQS